MSQKEFVRILRSLTARDWVAHLMSGECIRLRKKHGTKFWTPLGAVLHVKVGLKSEDGAMQTYRACQRAGLRDATVSSIIYAADDFVVIYPNLKKLRQQFLSALQLKEQPDL